MFVSFCCGWIFFVWGVCSFLFSLYITRALTIASKHRPNGAQVVSSESMLQNLKFKQSIQELSFDQSSSIEMRAWTNIKGGFHRKNTKAITKWPQYTELVSNCCNSSSSFVRPHDYHNHAQVTVKGDLGLPA